MKKLYLLIALSMIIALLAACAPQATSVPEVEAPVDATIAPTQAPATEVPVDAEEILIKFFHPSLSPDIDAYWKGVVDSFNATNEDGIVVELSTVDEETYKTKLDINLRSDEAPDVFYQWVGGKMAATVENGFGEPLNGFYDQYGWNETLSPGAVATTSLGDTKYAVCYNMTVYTFFYSKSLFEANGIAVPNTWDEMVSISDTLKAANIAPFIMGNKGRWEAQFPWSNLLIHKYGIDVWNQLVDNKIPWTDERVVDAFTMTKQLVDDGYFYPGINGFDYGEAVVPFEKSEAATIMYMGSFYPRFFTNEAVEPGVFTWPEMNPEVGKIPQVFCEGSVMINANSKNKDAAAIFVNHLISADSQSKFMAIQGGIATNMTADQSSLHPLVVDQLEIAKTAKVSFMPVDIQFDPSISTEFLDELQGVIEGTVSPEDAAAAIEAAAESFRGKVTP